MSLFIILTVILGVGSCVFAFMPAWRAGNEATRRKAFKLLIVIVIALVAAGGLYIFLGAPNIVMFTA